jgi:hypothetical protein
LFFVAIRHIPVTEVSDEQYGTFVVLRVCLRCVHDFTTTTTTRSLIPEKVFQVQQRSSSGTIMSSSTSEPLSKQQKVSKNKLWTRNEIEKAAIHVGAIPLV